MIDPFCGSGTVPVAAAMLGHAGIGVEVNPFLAFVSRAKSAQVSRRALDNGFAKVLRGVRRGAVSPLERYSTFSRGGGASKWLFNASVLRAFQGGWHACAEIKGSLRRVLQLSLLHAAMQSCNATRDGKCLRYKRDWRELKLGKPDFVAALEQHVAMVRADLEVPFGNGDAIIRGGDARQLLAHALSKKFDVCVTSPPYLNSFDYSDVYRPELFLGGFVDSNEALRKVRLRTVRSHVQVDWVRPMMDDFGPIYRDRIERLKAIAGSLWSRRIPLMVQAYFEDITHVLRVLRSRAQHHASLWVVVSTSAYGGIEIPVDLIIADIGVRSGWSLREVGVLRYLRTSGQHWHKSEAHSDGKPRLRESVIIFDAH